MEEQEQEQERRAASTGRRSLILPGRAGKLFPHSPKQQQLHSYDAEGLEEYDTVGNEVAPEAEIQHLIIVGIYESSSDVSKKSVHSLL